MDTIYQDIAARTGGNVYIGVVGPVRTGKSTLVKRIMETLVIPCIDDPHRRERARDVLPQSGSGRTIMTAEPKFVPEEAVEVSPDGKTTLRIRMIDSVGYMVEGAAGAEEEGSLGLLLEDLQAPQPQEELVRQELEHTMDALLGQLPERQQQLLRLRFGMEDGTCYALEAIGEKLGVSKERARQIERQAMDKLHKLSLDLGLEDFLS